MLLTPSTITWTKFKFKVFPTSPIKVFDITVVSKTRITKQTFLTINFNLIHYAIEFTPIESLPGEMVPYIASHLSYKSRPDLIIYKGNQFESTFVE